MSDHTSFTVSVFGGSAPLPGSDAYDQAERLGRLLAKNGFAVANGGYIGTMEAVSKGAASSGGHVIGVTCDQIEQWRDVRPNPWIEVEIRLPTLRARIVRLIEEAQAIVTLPGGIGTLSEIAFAWSMMQIGEIEPRAMILVGEAWSHTLHTFFETADAYVTAKDRETLTFVQDVEDVVEALQAWQGPERLQEENG